MCRPTRHWWRYFLRLPLTLRGVDEYRMISAAPLDEPSVRMPLCDRVKDGRVFGDFAMAYASLILVVDDLPRSRQVRLLTPDLCAEVFPALAHRTGVRSFAGTSRLPGASQGGCRRVAARCRRADRPCSSRRVGPACGASTSSRRRGPCRQAALRAAGYSTPFPSVVSQGTQFAGAIPTGQTTMPATPLPKRLGLRELLIVRSPDVDSLVCLVAA